MSYSDEHNDFKSFIEENSLIKHNDLRFDYDIKYFDEKLIKNLNKNKTNLIIKENFRHNIFVIGYYTIYNILRNKNTLLIVNNLYDKSFLFKCLLSILNEYSKRNNFIIKFESLVGSLLRFINYGNVRIVEYNSLNDTKDFKNDIVISYYDYREACNNNDIDIITKTKPFIVKDRKLTMFHECLFTDLKDIDLKKFSSFVDNMDIDKDLRFNFYDYETIIKDVIKDRDEQYNRK